MKRFYLGGKLPINSHSRLLKDLLEELHNGDCLPDAIEKGNEFVVAIIKLQFIALIDLVYCILFPRILPQLNDE